MILMYDMESSIYDVHKNDQYDPNIFITIFVQNKLQLIIRQSRTMYNAARIFYAGFSWKSSVHSQIIY